MNITISTKLKTLTYIFSAILTFTSFSACVNTIKPDNVQIWNRWSHTLISETKYENPYSEVQIAIKYTHSEGDTISGFAFWDGENDFTIRCMFPKQGIWTWETTCSDSSNQSLHHQKGKVDVTAYTGDNPLYQKGYFKVSANKRYLVHQNDSAFLWIGETSWAAIKNAKSDEWKQYLTKRKNQGFTVIQVFCASEWAGKVDVNGNKPFLKDTMTTWNPEYWREYEDRIHTANEMGFVVLVVGILDPTDTYKNLQKASVFARQLVARLMGNFVIFSPSFDSNYQKIGDEIGEIINNTTSLHLITQHPGTSLQGPLDYYNKSYLDFSSIQTGSGWTYEKKKINGKDTVITTLRPETLSKQLLEWIKIAYQQSPCKPLINLEARYDNALNQSQLQRLPRSCGYWSFLSGALGYTYGCAGLWNWGKIKPIDSPDTVWDAEMGLKQVSGDEMTYLSNFFSSIPWYKLEPASEYIINQANEWENKMVFSITDDKSVAVAYLPNNAEIILKSDAIKTFKTLVWFNPKTGLFAGKQNISVQNESNTFKRPIGWEDAVLLLKM